MEDSDQNIHHDWVKIPIYDQILSIFKKIHSHLLVVEKFSWSLISEVSCGKRYECYFLFDGVCYSIKHRWHQSYAIYLLYSLQSIGYQWRICSIMITIKPKIIQTHINRVNHLDKGFRRGETYHPIHYLLRTWWFYTLLNLCVRNYLCVQEKEYQNQPKTFHSFIT